MNGLLKLAARVAVPILAQAAAEWLARRIAPRERPPALDRDADRA